MKIETGALEAEALHQLIGDVLAPMPIALVSTVGRDGVYNAAPFSFVAPVCVKPLVLCFSFGLRQGQKKDTVRNIEASRELVLNVVDEGLSARAIAAGSAYPYGVSEISALGLTAVPGEKVRAPRIAESPVSLECRAVKISRLGTGPDARSVVFGEVLLVHLRDDLWSNGAVAQSRLRTVGRVGKSLYCRTTDVFERKIPPPPKP